MDFTITIMKQKPAKPTWSDNSEQSGQQSWNNKQTAGGTGRACLVCKGLVLWLDLVPLQGLLDSALIQAVCIRPFESRLRAASPMCFNVCSAPGQTPKLAPQWVCMHKLAALLVLSVHPCLAGGYDQYVRTCDNLDNRMTVQWFCIGFVSQCGRQPSSCSVHSCSVLEL